MGTVNFLEAVMGTHVDLSGLESGIAKAETMAEEGGKKIATAMKIGLGPIAAVTAIVGALTVALEKSVKTTAEFGLEMEHLANRMGMSVSQASTLVGVMERYGIRTGVAARSMQIMAMEAKQTTEALDPFKTKMGALLGTLRDTNGQALNMGQVFELARQKVAAAATDTEKLQVAQALVGNRMAGQLLPVLKLSNAEWEKQKASVAATLGPMEKSADAALKYKEATAALEQTFRGLQLALGTELLPTLTRFINGITDTIRAFEEFKKVHPILESLLNPLSLFMTIWKQIELFVEGVTFAVLQLAEKLHLVEKGTSTAYLNMQNTQDAARKAAAAAEDLAKGLEKGAGALGTTEKTEDKLVRLAKERLQYAEKLKALGLGTQGDVEIATQERLNQLTEQRLMLERDLARKDVTGDVRKEKEAELSKNRLEAAQAVAALATGQYKDEEALIKSRGALNLSTEIEFLQRRLADERTVGDERTKLEGELFQKRSQFAEQAMKLERDLGIATVDQEIAYRKTKAAELLGRGDVLGAGQEAIKMRDLEIKQGEARMDFVKKIRVVALQDEIEFQKQKLNLVKGNAEEEMKVLGQIADLDKQQYSKRLELGLNYTQSILDQYKKMTDAAKGAAGEEMTFDQARVDAQRKLIEETREMGQIGMHGGTEQQRAGAVEWAQMIQKRMEDMQQAGKNIDSTLRDASSAARDILKAASGGEEVRAPGGPNPTVGSVMSSVEGLATQGLARGSDIPRLDTSFTDLATRIRDVLLGAIPSVQSFSNAVAAAGNKIAQISGVGFSPNAALGPGGGITAGGQAQGTELGTSGSTPTPSPTVGPGGTPVQPTAQVGLPSSGGGADPIVNAISDLKESVVGALNKTATDNQTQAAANTESLAAALEQVRQARAAPTDVNVSMDPNSVVSAFERALI